MTCEITERQPPLTRPWRVPGPPLTIRRGGMPDGQAVMGTMGGPSPKSSMIAVVPGRVHQRNRRVRVQRAVTWPATHEAGSNPARAFSDLSEDMMRETWTGRTVIAGCFQCGGSHAKWQGPNAQGVAARHHDATGHTTWADVTLSITYGDRNACPTEAPNKTKQNDSHSD